MFSISHVTLLEFNRGGEKRFKIFKISELRTSYHVNVTSFIEWFYKVVLYFYYFFQFSTFVVCWGDSCARCSEDLSSCRHVSGLFMRRYMKEGYHFITRLPQGACHINITFLLPTKNNLGKFSVTYNDRYRRKNSQRLSVLSFLIQLDFFF